MFRSQRLIEAFEHVATAEEWRWFGPMVARGTMHVGVDGWPLFSHATLTAYDSLYQALVERTLQKLRSGEWIARGISPAYGPEARQIDTHLWDYLCIKHRGEEAEGNGFHFLALTISSLRPTELPVPQAQKALLRRQLTQWLCIQADKAKWPLLRTEQLAAVREAFPNDTITDNMFRDCRRAAQLPDHLVQKGRPKTKGSGF
ncbi:hypothetical protein ASG67_17245 [Sphingomonas sp. Leaf339]|uniref:hypothetical protein n=1 Tax=Sphingomonas sp. Leaf339 TaxID=1736343 RepID=UPI0006FE9045|nr:hypothetical protein [Sphingomonas sp. Leaf339]KQU57499.1 hypothetical protein ASG67_17245 [Sphingomonas sp. Leaf339]